MTALAPAAARLPTQFLGRVDYAPTYAAMRAFTTQRTPDTPDALWICEHEPVYTLGLAGNLAHVLNPGSIPVLQTDRGGQVTYHGPGQVVAYPLLDLRRAGYFIKEYVFRIEEAVIKTLAHFGVTGHRVRGAPGIYVRLNAPGSHARLPASFTAQQLSQQLESDPDCLGKIAALGIKLSRHCTTHGVALNVAMDLQPFSRINPCGYAGLQTVDLSTMGVTCTWNEAAQVLGQKLATYLPP
ncbi:MAG: lipoyl(octanoyl) transferase LipB [Burkholderiales bacterium]